MDVHIEPSCRECASRVWVSDGTVQRGKNMLKKDANVCITQHVAFATPYSFR